MKLTKDDLKNIVNLPGDNMEYGFLKLHEKLDGRDTSTTTTSMPTDDLQFIFDEINKANVSRSDNYVIDQKLMEKTLCYTVTTIKDEPVLASLAWNRPMYNNIIRLCTRYCINPKYSHRNFGHGTDGMRLDTMDHISQQVAYCSAKGYNDFFIGREDKSKGRRSKKIAKKVTEYVGGQWHSSDEEILLCPNPQDSSCWQYVIYNNRKDFNYEGIKF